MTFGERLKQLRTSRGITQEDLATSINVARFTLIRWEADTFEPRLSDLLNLSRVLDVPLDYLMTGKDCGSISTLAG